MNINTYYVHAHENYPYISFSKLSFFSRLNKYLISINAKIFNLLVSTKIIGPINTLFSSSQNEIKYSSFKKKNFLFFKINYKKFKNIIKINNKELYKVSNKKKKNNIIFLDIAAPFHKDQIYNGYKPIDENFYYTQMNRLLIMISKYIDCKVIIFPHPKYKKKSRLFSKNFKIVNQNQESYLKKSKIVFIHHTSAIFKAVNFKIKILQIQSKKFNSFIYKYNNFFKKKYSLESIDLEEQNVFKIKKKFLKSSHFYKEIEFNDKIDNIELISNFVSKNEK